MVDEGPGFFHPYKVGKCRAIFRIPQKFALVAAGVVVLSIGGGGPVRAQTAAVTATSNDGLADAVANLLSSLGSKADRLFEFLSSVEWMNAESEIDRLVGSPFRLHDSTTYKLGLLPFHIRYPIYKQVVAQMTRQDDLSSRRIYNVTPDSVSIISLRLDALSNEALKDEVRGSLLTHFNVREMVDLGFFMLGQQAFFPQTDEGWNAVKHSLARGGVAIAAGALAAGAAFDLGAFSQSGTIKKSDDGTARLGWYGGIRQLGFSGSPKLRAGLMGGLQGFEASAGLSERINPAQDRPVRTLELALREGWLNRLTQPLGWDLVVETAYQRVLSAGPLYLALPRSGRAGVFVKRQRLSLFPSLALRGIFEIESDFSTQHQMAAGLGVEHASSGTAVVLQGSRTPLREIQRVGEDTRGGIFVAGTLEPLTEVFQSAMQVAARRAREQWDAGQTAEADRRRWEGRLLAITRAPPSGTAASQLREALAGMQRAERDREIHLAAMAALLPEYLDRRRTAYALLHWQPGSDDLHGPLDPQILLLAREQIFNRLDRLAAELEMSVQRLEYLNTRHQELTTALVALEAHSPGSPATTTFRIERAAVELVWRRENDVANVRTEGYAHFRDHGERFLAVAGKAAHRRNADPAKPGVLRQVMAFAGVSLR